MDDFDEFKPLEAIRDDTPAKGERIEVKTTQSSLDTAIAQLFFRRI